VVTVVTSLELDYIYEIINKAFGHWTREMEPLLEAEYEKNKPGIFFNRGNIEGAKLQFCYRIEDLDWRELEALKYFNIIFGEGTSSILYDEVRTEKALAYEVGSHIKNERGIKLFSINISTSKDNISEAIKSVENCIEKVKDYNWEDADNILKIKKRLALKESLALEKSIELCKRIATTQLMFGDYKHSLESYNNYDISCNDIKKTIEKVFKNPSIQIFSSGEGVVGAWKDDGC
jgi:predicted Zn-dependent peptidase